MRPGDQSPKNHIFSDSSALNNLSNLMSSRFSHQISIQSSPVRIQVKHGAFFMTKKVTGCRFGAG